MLEFVSLRGAKLAKPWRQPFLVGVGEVARRGGAGEVVGVVVAVVDVFVATAVVVVVAIQAREWPSETDSDDAQVLGGIATGFDVE